VTGAWPRPRPAVHHTSDLRISSTGNVLPHVLPCPGGSNVTSGLVRCDHEWLRPTVPERSRRGSGRQRRNHSHILGRNQVSLTDEEQHDYFNPDGKFEAPDGETPDNVIIGAPDYASFVKGTRSTTAREYEKKVQSVLKSGLMHSLGTGNLPDAAVYLHFGPNFASTAGDLADKDERVAKAIDMITAPDNPYVAFGIAAVALLGQFARNHEDTLRAVPAAVKEGRRERKARKVAERANGIEPSKVNIRLPFGRTVSFAFGIKFGSIKNVGKLLRFQTREPVELVNTVFTDEKLLKALSKEGIVIRSRA